MTGAPPMEAQHDCPVWLKRWKKRYAKLTERKEANLGETLYFYRLPNQHQKAHEKHQ